jgi:hypothetical protein
MSTATVWLEEVRKGRLTWFVVHADLASDYTQRIVLGEGVTAEEAITSAARFARTIADQADALLEEKGIR